MEGGSLVRLHKCKFIRYSVASIGPSKIRWYLAPNNSNGAMCKSVIEYVHVVKKS